jgi:hypothetical protein
VIGIATVAATVAATAMASTSVSYLSQDKQNMFTYSRIWCLFTGVVCSVIKWYNEWDGNDCSVSSRTEEKHEIFRQDCMSMGSDLKQDPPGYRAAVLPVACNTVMSGQS